ncbi:MAG: flavodoxin domain-containing protein [Burkholderiales bacterium]|nr:flavodoxin domain-containing protein [Burkholderiales bacterium]
MKVTLLVVTMTGTAEMIAEDLVAAFSKEHELTMVLAERTQPELFDGTQHLVVVSSTYGEGEVPDPGKPLYEGLRRKDGELKGLRYGVVSLGDSIYKETFANGGRLWDALLAERGATRLAETLLLDASGSADMSALAVDWFGAWLRTAAQAETTA